MLGAMQGVNVGPGAAEEQRLLMLEIFNSDILQVGQAQAAFPQTLSWRSFSFSMAAKGAELIQPTVSIIKHQLAPKTSD